jgi:hypothetical protein
VKTPDSPGGAVAKEVRPYSNALQTGFAAVRQNGLLTGHHVLEIQTFLESNRARVIDANSRKTYFSLSTATSWARGSGP